MSLLLVNKQTIRFAMIALVTVATVGNTGCRHNQCGQGMSNCLQKCFSRKGARHRAADAWDACPNRCASDDVRQGFIDGYCDVALGGRGCTPAVAPSQYWGWRYSGIEGQQAGAQWLQGYPLGALAAQGEGASYRVATLDVPTEAEHRQASYNQSPRQQEFRRDIDPGPDTIDDTIEMPPAYLDSPSDTYEQQPDATDATEAAEAAEDALEDATRALEEATDSAHVPVEKTDQLKVQTITNSEGKSIKHLMTTETPKTAVPSKRQFVAPLPPKTVSTVVEKTVSTVKQKVAAPAQVVAPVKEVTDEVKKVVPEVVKEVVKATVNDIPELDLQQNDEVFGFGIE